MAIKYDLFSEQVMRLTSNSANVVITDLRVDPFQAVAKELAERRECLGYDIHQKKAEQDWSSLNSQIVGAETF